MNTYTFSIISLFIISQGFFLLNEEFLILLCFILFLWISYEKLSLDFYNFFNDNSIRIKDSLSTSFVKRKLMHIKLLNFNYKILKIQSEILLLKIYYKNSNNKIINKLLDLQKFKKNIIFYKKLDFIKNLESQVSKLILLILIEKINKLIILNNFYANKCHIKKFKHFNKLKFKEYLKFLD